jgi:hypothetical protein
MLLLEGYISNFTCATYSLLYVEFSAFYGNQSLAGQTIPFLQYEKPCLQLHDLLYDHLFQNSVFSCAQHKAAACKIIIKTAVKPVRNNICVEKTDSLKTELK